MKIKLNTILQNVYGEPLKSQRKKPKPKGSEKPVEYEDFSLREVILTALTNFDLKDKDKVSGDDKALKYELILRIQMSKNEAEFDSKEIVLIKDLISETWPSSLVSGQAWKLIEPKG